MGSAAARSQIRILESLTYLDNASAGPLPDATRRALVEFAELWASRGEPWEEGWRAVYESKKLFASLVGASLEEVAAFPGVTYALAVTLSSLRLRDGCVAVASSLNFPTSTAVLKSMARRGLLREVRIARETGGLVELDEYRRLVDDSVCLVVADYVGWLSGHVESLRELSEIAHARGAILVTDAFHAVGVMPVDVRLLGVDVMVTGSYKWLMAPHGAALAFVSRDIVEELDPSYAGWLALEDSVVSRILRGEPEFARPIDIENLELARDARKLEWGTLPLVSFYALRESLRFLLQHEAVEVFESHTRRLAARLIDELEDLGLEVYTPRERHSAIVTFKHPEPRLVAGELARRGIIVAARPGLVRVSPHFYNNYEDIEKLVGALEEILRARRTKDS
ncbi:MAG: aminotransferase class V-fold PLP-dependent enzyme [Acidilobaceae archaeon]